MKKLYTHKSGFTLIELLVVISIIAVLVAFSVANFVGARSRARDVRKKSEIQEVKNALRLYYNDYNSYPGPASAATNTFNGCGTVIAPATTPTASCGNAPCNGQFAAGGVDAAVCGSITYMKLLPDYSPTNWYYTQTSGGDDFCLYTTLENKSDGDIAKSQARCSSCAVGDINTDYVVCSD